MTKRTDIPINTAVVGAAIMRLGGKARLSAIYQEVKRIDTGWKVRYKDELSFEGVVRATIEAHCPQSDKFCHPDLPLFEWQDSGFYRVVPTSEWEAAVGKRKPLGGNRPK